MTPIAPSPPAESPTDQITTTEEIPMPTLDDATANLVHAKVPDPIRDGARLAATTSS